VANAIPGSFCHFQPADQILLSNAALDDMVGPACSAGQAADVVR